MGLPTAAWFALGCGLAVSMGAAGHLALSSVRSHGRSVWPGDGESASLQALTPAPDEPTSTVIAPHPDPDVVPMQRPRHLRDTVAPPHADWGRGDARLPTPEATAYWNPDDPRMPDGETSVVAVRAYWNPDSATLPRPTTERVSVWNPDDARLPL